MESLPISINAVFQSPKIEKRFFDFLSKIAGKYHCDFDSGGGFSKITGAGVMLVI